MNEAKKNLLRKAGFAEEVKQIEARKCPFCKQKVDMDAFRDDLSRREFEISGICAACQDETFGGEDE